MDLITVSSFLLFVIACPILVNGLIQAWNSTRTLIHNNNFLGIYFSDAEVEDLKSMRVMLLGGVFRIVVASLLVALVAQLHNQTILAIMLLIASGLHLFLGLLVVGRINNKVRLYNS